MMITGTQPHGFTHLYEIVIVFKYIYFFQRLNPNRYFYSGLEKTEYMCYNQTGGHLHSRRNPS